MHGWPKTIGRQVWLSETSECNIHKYSEIATIVFVTVLPDRSTYTMYCYAYFTYNTLLMYLQILHY